MHSVLFSLIVEQREMKEGRKSTAVVNVVWITENGT